MAGRWVRARALETRRLRVFDMAMGLTPSCFFGMPISIAEERKGAWSGGRWLEAAASMNDERRDRKVETRAGLFGRWSASFRWEGRRPVGPGEEWEGNERMSLRTVSGVRPCGKGLSSGRRPRSDELEGRGWRCCSLVKAEFGSIGGGGGVSKRRALVRDPDRVAWMAC